MANIKSAIKQIRIAERKHARNRPVRTGLKTYVGKARRAIDTGDTTASAAAVVTAISELDKAASKGIIHPNNAARRKSRLMARLNKAATQNPQA